MGTEAEELSRILSTSVRDMLDAYRFQARPVTDKALEQSLAPSSGPQRVAMLPNVMRMLLTTFPEEVARPLSPGSCGGGIVRVGSHQDGTDTRSCHRLEPAWNLFGRGYFEGLRPQAERDSGGSDIVGHRLVA